MRRYEEILFREPGIRSTILTVSNRTVIPQDSVTITSKTGFAEPRFGLHCIELTDFLTA